MSVQLVSPVAQLRTVNAEHPTAGLPGYPAHDWFAPVGTGVISPADGRVTRLSGHDPREGPVSGPHGPFGWSVYITGFGGAVWYLTHLGRVDVKAGQVVKRGQRIGTVADWPRYGTPAHIHLGVHVDNT